VAVLSFVSVLCFPFFCLWAGILCAFSSASDTLGYGVAGSLYSFLLFLEFHDGQIALYVAGLLLKSLFPVSLT
jgi:hypothetical protein